VSASAAARRASVLPPLAGFAVLEDDTIAVEIDLPAVFPLRRWGPFRAEDMRRGFFGILVFAFLASACGIGGRLEPAAARTETPPAASLARGTLPARSPTSSFTNTKTVGVVRTDTPSRTPEPGIDTPVVVRGISLKISRVEKAGEYLSEAAEPGRKFLFIYIDIVAGKISMLDFSRWQMSLTGEKGAEYRQKGAFIHPGETPDSSCCAEWIYDVGEKDAVFIFHFPEGPGIPLDSLLT
jgi:hypothetical protein